MEDHDAGASSPFSMAQAFGDSSETAGFSEDWANVRVGDAFSPVSCAVHPPFGFALSRLAGVSDAHGHRCAHGVVGIAVRPRRRAGQERADLSPIRIGQVRAGQGPRSRRARGAAAEGGGRFSRPTAVPTRAAASRACRCGVGLSALAARWARSALGGASGAPSRCWRLFSEIGELGRWNRGGKRTPRSGRSAAVVDDAGASNGGVRRLAVGERASWPPRRSAGPA